MDRLNIDCEQDNQIHLELQEKDRLLQEKQCQLEELKGQWETERAELVRPALQQVNSQLEELKETVRNIFLILIKRGKKPNLYICCI